MQPGARHSPVPDGDPACAPGGPSGVPCPEVGQSLQILQSQRPLYPLPRSGAHRRVLSPQHPPFPVPWGGPRGREGCCWFGCAVGRSRAATRPLGWGCLEGEGVFFFLTNSQKFGGVQKKKKPFLQHGGKRVIDLALKAQGSPFPAGAGPILPGHRQPHAGDGSSWPPLPGARPLFPAAFSSRDKTHLCWP